MQKINLEDLKVGDWVYYVPDHFQEADGQPEPGQEYSKGYVTRIEGDQIWVRFFGPTGELCKPKNLYK